MTYLQVDISDIPEPWPVVSAHLSQVSMVYRGQRGVVNNVCIMIPSLNPYHNINTAYTGSAPTFSVSPPCQLTDIEDASADNHLNTTPFLQSQVVDLFCMVE